MLKTMHWPASRLAASLAALRARMARRPLRAAVCLGLGAGAVNFLLGMSLVLVAMALFTPQQVGNAASSSLQGASTAAVFWTVVVWAPLFETVIGQWLPLEVLRRYKVRAGYSLLASGVLFSLLHVMSGAGILHASVTLIGGCIFAASYLAARSMGPAPAYVAAATAHACSNGLMLCGSLLFPELGG